MSLSFLVFVFLVVVLAVLVTVLVLDWLKKHGSHSHSTNVAEPEDEPNSAYTQFDYDS